MFKVTLRSESSSKTKTVSIAAATADDAFNEASLMQGWLVQDVVAVTQNIKQAGILGISTSSVQKKISPKELIRFCEGLSTMLTAGISTVDAIRFYANALPDAGKKNLFLNIAADIERGEAPDVAFAKTGVFTDIFTGLIKAGVSSGELANALASVAHQTRIIVEFSSRLRRILITPIAVLVILTGIFIAAQIILTPRIETMLAGCGANPDVFSAAVFGMSHFIQATWILFVISVVAIAVIIFKSRPLKTFLLNAMMSKWRLLRNVIMGMRQLLFIGTLNMVVGSRVPMEEALKVCAFVLRGSALGDEVETARTQYLSGIECSECIKRYTSCEAHVVHMLAIGEKTGTLLTQLSLCTTMLEAEAKTAMDDFAVVSSTISTVIPIFVIGFTFITSYLPIVLMSTSLMNSFTQ